VSRRRSDSRRGPSITKEQIKAIEKIFIPLLNKGQPLAHIYAEHEAMMPISLRTLYDYIDRGWIKIKSIDLRRKVSYKQRKKSRYEPSTGFLNQTYRIGRTYQDYESVVNRRFSDFEVVEMDTVKGCRESGKRLLTMIFRENSIMLLFLMPDGTADSVIRVFDYLEAGLGIERFQRLFPAILTDNGSEFKRVDALELTDEWSFRTSIYYCDPMASWQKPHIEKNHEYIRYVLPKGTSLSPYTQNDITLLMNHINSTSRVSLGHNSPYQMIPDKDKDMEALMRFLKMEEIPMKYVNLSPSLLEEN
jgi:IS30 family transposase